MKSRYNRRAGAGMLLCSGVTIEVGIHWLGIARKGKPSQRSFEPRLGHVSTGLKKAGMIKEEIKEA